MGTSFVGLPQNARRGLAAAPFRTASVHIPLERDGRHPVESGPPEQVTRYSRQHLVDVLQV